MHKDSKSSTTRLALTSAFQTVGLDVGDRFSHFCELDRDGEIIAQGRMRTTAEAMRSHFGERVPLSLPCTSVTSRRIARPRWIVN